MRDPNRLENFYEDFKLLHKQNVPDWRFGQLIVNFFSWIMSTKKRDVFFIEENTMIEYFREYMESIK